ncbi:head GIN domain-containing protein [Dyadobacter arcticus]|uniref:Putative auto-transporter adhesin head GIN domain-containing protein n=1 Tax=Dyadobacter arcticus TaxID=1078754 RepID=A0ABX0UQY3_9BACT|nr:head GIN domain-containing protein [Dyadobacter arcticus]NIJ53406.1 hypothetical protein [Dyadobacter arcticus]
MKKSFQSIITLFLILAGLQSCVYVESEDNIPPRGESTRDFDFKNFDQLVMGNAYHVHVKSGAAFAVSATGELNDLDDLNIFVQDRKLVIRYQSSWKNRRQMDIEITMPDLERVDFSGAVTSKIEGFENLPDIEFELSGASKCDFSGSGQELKFDISGASRLNLDGDGKFLDGELSGASQLDAFEMPVEESKLDVSGASSAKVWVSKFLEVEANGASTVRYKGGPEVKKEVTGGSTVRMD